MFVSVAMCRSTCIIATWRSWVSPLQTVRAFCDFGVQGKLDPKKLQLQLTGFLEKSTGTFMEELWGLLVDAQNSLGGIPSAFLQDKKQEMLQAKVWNRCSCWPECHPLSLKYAQNTAAAVLFCRQYDHVVLSGRSPFFCGYMRLLYWREDVWFIHNNYVRTIEAPLSLNLWAGHGNQDTKQPNQRKQYDAGCLDTSSGMVGHFSKPKYPRPFVSLNQEEQRRQEEELHRKMAEHQQEMEFSKLVAERWIRSGCIVSVKNISTVSVQQWKYNLGLDISLDWEISTCRSYFYSYYERCLSAVHRLIVRAPAVP